MRYAIIIGIVLCAMMVPGTQAQLPAEVYAFGLVSEDDTTVTLEPGANRAEFELTLTDYSKDAPDGILADQDTNAGLIPHRTTFAFSYGEDDNAAGWAVAPPPPTRTFGGDEKTLTLRIQNQLTVIQDPIITVTLNATHRFSGGVKYTEIPFTIITGGPNNYNALVKTPSKEIAPNDIDQVTIAITNSGLLPREFVIESSVNSCNLDIGFEALRVVDAKQTLDIDITVLGPDDKFWYNFELCDLDLVAYPADQPGNTRVLSLDPVIQGTQIDPVWVFNFLIVLVAVIILLLLIARRKSRIEEEILGRPQKPWLIPVERVYLDHLRERDPQAHYVVRHFLMEEEYQSSLLWYHDYKKATKGSRAKERLVVGQEHKYDRFQKRWQRRIAAPGKQVDRLAASLQKKLDRQGKSGARQERRKWKKLVRTMKAAHEKKVAKAMAKWEKQRAKAEKKKRPVPEKPSFGEPDYPPEPSGDRMLLESHKWNKKVVKARAKATKKAGNLEVKFEKKDAKMLRKVRKKVLKIARKLDDPEFASEHPLLASEA
ncbi:MAG: hypothetical protein ACPHID_03050 [Thermoplasmatota archaeon]